MTIEYILLLGLFAYILMGAFTGEKGPLKVFENSAPRLGARVEQQMATGGAFNFPRNDWQLPPGGAPTGMPQ
ncbi:MAG: hypothetical protein IT287_08670 [Bdellovibrionaceae bacterium]|nr:hypothetical protein [Pseudobdellovibrionaceae bacterium]